MEDEERNENQGVENESSVAMLRSQLPANTDLQDLIGNKHLKPRKNTHAFKPATKQTSQTQRRKTQDSTTAYNTANPTEKSLNNPMQNRHILRTQTKDHELQPSLTPYSVPTSLDPQNHSAISFNTSNPPPLDPNYTMLAGTKQNSSVSKYHNQLFDPLGEPPDTGRVALNEDMDEDSDYRAPMMRRVPGLPLMTPLWSVNKT